MGNFTMQKDYDNIEQKIIIRHFLKITLWKALKNTVFMKYC